MKVNLLVKFRSKYDFGLFESKSNELFLLKTKVHSIEKYNINVNKVEYQGIVSNHVYKPNAVRPDFAVLPNKSILYFDELYNPHLSTGQTHYFGSSLYWLEKTYIDREGNLWITTNNGLYNYFNLNFEEIKLNLASPDNIWSILEDNNHNMWFGSYGWGLWRTDRRNNLLAMNKLHHDWARQYMAASKSKDGTLFIPNGGGLLIYKNGKCINTETSTCLSAFFDEQGQHIYYSGIKPKENLKGLNIDYGKNHKFIPWKVGFPISITKDSKAAIRVGGFRGQGVLQGDSIKTDTKSRDYEGVVSMSTDNKGRLWKGTNKGVYVELPEGNEFRVAPQIKGMITSLIVWHNKYLLCGTVDGLGVIHIEDNLIHPEVWKIGYDGGFTGLESGQNAFFEDHNADVWMCTAISVMKFSPEKLVQSQKQFIPNIRVESISYSKDIITWHKDFLLKPRIDIDPSYKFIRIEYLANSITAPKSLRFKFRLKGFSENWSNEVSSKSVDYTNLNYGKYCFEVKCSLDGEHWSKIAYSPTFEIMTPIWLRWYAKLTYLLIFTIVIVFITRYFVSQNQEKKMDAIKRTKLENELQLSTLRSKVIPHFTKNVLSAIGYFAMTDKLKAGHYISVFSKFTGLTLANADKNYISLRDELEYIQKYIELEKMRFGDKFEYKIIVGEDVLLNIMIPTMTLHTYCDNAIRHGLVHKNGNGYLEINICEFKYGILLTITDNGIGRKRAHELGTHGNGQGLKLIQAQLDFYNQLNEKHIYQKISDLEDVDGISLGTKVEFFVPFEYKFI
ncbi:MAG: histidine kinase [Bacteroidales bacterium]